MASTKKPDFWEGFEAIKDRNWTIQKKWPMLWDLGVIGQHLFSMRTSQLDKNSLKSNKSFKRHPNKKKHKLHWSCLRSQNPLVTLRGVFLQKALGIWIVMPWPTLGWLNVGMMDCEKPALKKKTTEKEWSAKIPTKTDSTVSVVSSTCGSKGQFLFFETSTVKDWNEVGSSNLFLLVMFLMGGHLKAKPSVPISVMNHH